VFDSHCHLHANAAGAAQVIARAREAGVRGFMLAGVEPDGWLIEAELARAHEGVLVSYGVHPQLIAELDDAACDRLVDQLRATLAAPPHPPSAIGEIGLDGERARRASFARQERVFRAQLALARASGLPVILHVLDAHARALAVLRDVAPLPGGVVHSYSGSAELVREYVALGFHVSFAGPVTSERAKKTRRAAEAVPRERLLVETDAPFQTPAAHRPLENEPAFLVAIVRALAQIRAEPFDELAAYTATNAQRLFGVK